MILKIILILHWKSFLFDDVNKFSSIHASTCIMTNDINKWECKSCKQNETETTKIYIYFAQCHHVNIICVEKKSVLFKCFSSQTEQSQK